MEVKNEKDLDKITTLGGSEFLRAITSAGKSVLMTLTNVAEALRSVMSSATTVKAGLMPRITGRSPFQVYVALDQGLEETFNYSYGMISLYSVQKGYSSAILLSTRTLKILGEIGLIQISTVADTDGKINIYKKSENEFVVQNKTNDQFRFYISSL